MSGQTCYAARQHRRGYVPALLYLCLAGCAPGMLISQSQSYSGKESIPLAAPRADILDTVAAVGKDMGYEVANLDREHDVITISAGSSGFGMYLTGKYSSATISVQVKDDGRKLETTVSVMGNFGSGGQEAADKLIDDFKNRLYVKLGEKPPPVAASPQPPTR